jgi:hypothetical protein
MPPITRGDRSVSITFRVAARVPYGFSALSSPAKADDPAIPDSLVVERAAFVGGVSHFQCFFEGIDECEDHRHEGRLIRPAGSLSPWVDEGRARFVGASHISSP